MEFKNFLVENSKILFYLSLILIVTGLAINFIITIIWWSRIQPWLLHSKYSGKFVCLSTLICWFLSLIGFIFTMFIIFFKKLFKLEFQQMNFTSNLFCICVSISVFSLLSSIFGISASSYALKNEKVSLGKFGKLNNKCYSYILQYSTIKEWAIKNGKEAEFEIWYKKLTNKISNCRSGGCDHKNPYNQYLCLDIGAPTLVFSIAQIVGVIILMLLTIAKKSLNFNIINTSMLENNLN